MAYVQRFGLSRKSPLAVSGTPAHDVIKKNVEKEPSESKGWWDWVSDGLTVAGMVPGLGIIPDGINAAGNLVAAGHAALTGGDTAKYLTNATLAGGAMIPGVGQAVSGTKLAAKVLPKTVKTIQGLEKGSKVLKAGELAGKTKKMKLGAKYLLGSADHEDHKDKIIPAGYVVSPNTAP